ncbi:MAG: helix-turn-helix transcriptional regulator [Rhodobacter sp.]|nr:helix-turn-helix transcriptional regulator [Rhodobacter sp.]
MNNLAQFRDLKGWSQKDLADIVGLNQSTIQRAETEHPSAKLATYKKCADVLGVSLCDIFCEQRSDLEAAVLKILSEIPSERHQEVLALFQLARNRVHEEDE